MMFFRRYVVVYLMITGMSLSSFSQSEAEKELAKITQSQVEKGLAEITLPAVQGPMEFLSSDLLEGRRVGTRGGYLAAEYIASLFRMYGLQPIGDTEYWHPSRRDRLVGKEATATETYFQNFSLLEYGPGREQHLSLFTEEQGIGRSVTLQYESDFSVDPGMIGRTGSAPLVFAGYGYRDRKEAYNDLKGVDLKGRIAVIMTGFPGHRDPASKAYKQLKPATTLAMSNLEINKIKFLVEAGALAVIRIDPYGDPAVNWSKNRVYPVNEEYYEADSLLPSIYDKKLIHPGDTLANDIPVFDITGRIAALLLSGTGISPERFEADAKRKMQPASMPVTGKTATFQTTVESRVIKARNVLGLLEGEKKDEYIVIGGHYDHLGKWNGWTFNGADDNASGTVAVLTLAKAFQATGKKPEKSIIFACWDGEERGLRGARYFVRKALQEEKKILLNVNFDMIARNPVADSLGNRVSMMYVKTHPELEALAKRNVAAYDLNLDVSYRSVARTTGSSDHTAFSERDIPFVYVYAGIHPTYHLPSDEIGLLNWDKLVNVIRLWFLNVWEMGIRS